MMNCFAPSDDILTGHKLYFYANLTNKVQIIKITNIPEYCWERVVFSGQRLIFKAMTSDVLEVYTTESATAILADIIPCQKLCVVDDLIMVKSQF